MTEYTLKLRCPVCGYIDEGVGHEAGSVYQARNIPINCPHHDGEIMNVVEVASSEGVILWQDLAWRKEVEKTANEIEGFSKKEKNPRRRKN